MWKDNRAERCLYFCKIILDCLIDDVGTFCKYHRQIAIVILFVYSDMDLLQEWSCSLHRYTMLLLGELDGSG